MPADDHMTNVLPISPESRPDTTLEAVIARHGIRAVLFAALRAALRRERRRPPHPGEILPDHLRRDVGLPPRAPPPRPRIPPF